MIVWCASYPKSGNTWIRAIIVSLLYSEDGIFNFNMLKKMGQFPIRHQFKDFIEDSFVNLSDNVLKDIDCVIHLAALKAAGESMENPIKYSNQNIIESIRYCRSVSLSSIFILIHLIM